MDSVKSADQIIQWLKQQIIETKQKGFVIGVSGGVDSAVVSTLCAMTGEPTIVVSLPIDRWNSKIPQSTILADKHMAWLTSRHPNVRVSECYLDKALYSFEGSIWSNIFEGNPYSIDTNENRDLVSANLRSRLRMCALYAYANASRFLVAGTGNKVEDFGIGFFTKHGDGGIDLSPIGDLLKSEVQNLAFHLDINGDIVSAAPTDGLWADGRTDEMAIGATYDELEWAMKWLNDEITSNYLTERMVEVLNIYKRRHFANQHKMKMPPICRIER